MPGWHGDTEQALQQFVNQSVWDEQAVLQTYRRVMGEAFDDPEGIVVIDDTGFAKKGRHSVGVTRQYSGTLGKTDNCQVAVSLHYAAPKGDYPLALRLFLPESWTSQPERMQAARVPLEHQTHRTKNEIALDLLDQMHAEGLPYRAVVADAGYGLSVDFRRGLDERGVQYVVGIAGNEAVLTELPTWSVKAEVEGRGRPPTRWYLPADATPPVAVKRLAETLERTPFSWRQGTKRPLQAEFAWMRVWPAHRWGMGRAADDVPDLAAETRWLLVEWRTDGSIRYALSNLPANSHAGAGGRLVEKPLAGGAGLSTTQGGTGPGPLRGSLLAGLPPPCRDVLPGVWLPGPGACPRHAHRAGRWWTRPTALLSIGTRPHHQPSSPPTDAARRFAAHSSAGWNRRVHSTARGAAACTPLASPNGLTE